jgi:hypothetical protein
MASTTAACPFCNAELPPLTAMPTAPRTACPRCGEPVPSERFPIAAVAPPPQSPSVADRKRRTLQIVLAIMAGMAALALVFALLTQDMRRRNDFRNKPRDESSNPAGQNPAQLLGLGYLPSGSNVAFGLHVSALTRDAVGRILLRDPYPAPLDKVLGTLEMVGLTVDDVDHVVAGGELKDLSFCLTTVIVTREPYDAERVKKAIERRPVSATTFRKGTLYRFKELPGVPKLWCAGPRVLVYTTLTTDQLERIPVNVKEPPDTLTSSARTALTERLSKQSRAWIVGDLEPAKDLIDLAQIGFLPKAQARALTLVRRFAVGVIVPEGETPTLAGDFYTGAAAATQELRGYLDAVKLAKAKSHKVETPPADVQAAEAQWVSWQVHADAEALRDALGTLPPAPGKTKKAGP